MESPLSGVKGLFWNTDENRLRTPFRIPVVVVLVLVVTQLLNGVLDGLQNLSGLTLPSVLASTLLLGVLSVCFVAIAWFIDKRRRRDFGLELDRQWYLDTFAGLLTGLAMVATVVVVLRAVGMATVGGDYLVDDPTIAIGDSATEAFFYGLAFFTAVAVLEELAVRSYLLTNVAEGIRWVRDDEWLAVTGAVLATALVFGVLHAANPAGSVVSLLNISLAGILLGAAYAATGRVGFPIGLHTTWNFGLGPLFGLPVSGLRTDAAVLAVQVDGPTLVTGGAFGPEGGLVMLAALAVGAGMVAVWLRRTADGLTIDRSVAVPDLWSGERSDS